MTPFGEIHLPSKDYDEIKDFSSTKAVDAEHKKRWFIHEMAHVWQYFAMGISVACRGVSLAIKGGYDKKHKSGRLMAYAYDLLGADARKEFKDFNIEQQADIICHYYLVQYERQFVLRTPAFNYLLSEQANRKYILREFLVNPTNKKLKSEQQGFNNTDENIKNFKRAIQDKFYRKGPNFYSL